MQKHFTVLFSPYGYATENVYNQFGDIVKRIQIEDDQRGDDWRQLITLFNYDDFGRLVEEFDVYTTTSNSNEKLQLGDLILAKEKSVKTAESTITDKLNGNGYVAVVRKLPMQQTKYDFTGRTIATVDAKQNETTYNYDSLGRQVTIIQPSANGNRLLTEDYFDNAGNLATKVVVPIEAQTFKPVGERRIVQYTQ
jgi:YD repeat-containing protein